MGLRDLLTLKREVPLEQIPDIDIPADPPAHIRGSGTEEEQEWAQLLVVSFTMLKRQSKLPSWLTRLARGEPVRPDGDPVFAPDTVDVRPAAREAHHRGDDPVQYQATGSTTGATGTAGTDVMSTQRVLGDQTIGTGTGTAGGHRHSDSPPQGPIQLVTAGVTVGPPGEERFEILAEESAIEDALDDAEAFSRDLGDETMLKHIAEVRRMDWRSEEFRTAAVGVGDTLRRGKNRFQAQGYRPFELLCALDQVSIADDLTVLVTEQRWSR